MAANDFRPAWWLRGAHAQTLGARLLRRASGARFRRERVELPDGDFLDLDWVEQAGGAPADGGAPLAIVLHGLEGCARSGYALEAYRALLTRGLAAVGLNFRSCSGEPNRLPRLYHSGETGDLAYVVSLLAQRFPGRALGALGFSLGGNVLLKYLGESGAAGAAGAEGAEGAGASEVGSRTGTPLRAAAAISVPFDLSAGADYLERGFRRVYRRYLVERLRRKLRAKATILRQHLDLDRVLSARTFRQFDEAATAVLHGFVGAEDYYRRSSAGAYLDAIRVPTLLVHARDDPFLPPHTIPHARVRANPRLTARFTERGGHVGFVTGPPWAPVFWAEREAAEYLAARLGSGREE
jgi:hypothetical protein